MNLFHKDKDLVHRIANLAFILWIVIALFITYNAFVNLVVKKDKLSYNEYKDQYCSGNIKLGSITDSNDGSSGINIPGEYCKSNYERYKIDRRDLDYINKKSLINGFGNVIIVGITLYIINRKKD